jgi:DNA-binding NarL/FixJ family response regulator
MPEIALRGCDDEHVEDTRVSVLPRRYSLLVVVRPLEAEDARLSALTPAQRGVLALLVDGLTNAAIAKRRRTSARTVANQVASLLRALGCASRVELALLARLAGGGIGREGQEKA